MSATTTTNIRPRDVFQALTNHPWRWAAPTVALTLLAVVYALVRPNTWEANQALLVRDEVIGSAARPGKFNHVEEMKTVQETILELIKSRGVSEAALADVGPPAGSAVVPGWPTDAAIEALQASVKLSPPKGAEFGKTEVFYLKVQAENRQRSVALAEAICHQLQGRFEQLRVTKYQSVIDELEKTVSLAQTDLKNSTATLAGMEKTAGPDLAELRILNEAPASDSGLHRTANELEAELRTSRAAVGAGRELLSLLEASQVDAGRLLASPSRLLESQPALRRLKDGLVDAQLRTAQLLGSMSQLHPQVLAAAEAEQEISRELHNEIAIAVKGVQVDLRLAEDRVQTLVTQQADVRRRLVQLAEMRAEYANVVVAARHRSEMLKTTQQELSEAKASQASARTSSLITLIDRPDAGSRPVGPGRATIVLAGLFGGLLAGCGIVFLTVEPTATVVVSGKLLKEILPPVPPKSGRKPLPAGSLSIKQALEKITTPTVYH